MSYSIDVQNLCVFAGSTQLMGPVSFQVNAGETLVIMGETGAGKSLIAQAILGTLPAALHAKGEISINGQRVDTLSLGQRAALWGREIATLPQEPWRALDPLMQAFKQVNEAHRYVADQPKAAAKRATTNDFHALDLVGAEQRLPNALSGGMAQRVAFAAATAAKAPILLADEPTKGLDAKRHAKVIDLLAQVPQSGGTLVAITHEVAVARRLGGMMMVMRDGVLVEQGSVDTILKTPRDAFTRALLNADPHHWPDSKPRRFNDCILCVRDLAVTRGMTPLFKGFNLDVHAGEKVALTGPSGIGKTTLLDALAGLLPATSGSVTRGKDMPKTGIQKLYQDPPAAFPNRVPLVRTLRDVARAHKTNWSDVLGFLDQLGVHPSLLDRLPDAVSGGELQRISIARALTVRPKVLLADEPTSRLDPITQRETLGMLDTIARSENIAIVLVTHDTHIAQKWADREISLV